MPFREDEKDYAFDRTNGRCHLCKADLVREAYGRFGDQGSWEIDHSKAQALGGTHHRNNLYPACISCNRSKGARTSGEIRSKNGVSGVPWSADRVKQAKEQNGRKGALIGGASGAALGTIGGPVGMVVGGFIGMVAGAVIGENQDPED